MYKINEWFEQDGYRLKLVEIKEEGIAELKAVRIHVVYENHTDEPLNYVTLQWLVYDKEGYSYKSTITRTFYGDDFVRKLPEGLLSPGKSVRGWVAFELPQNATPDYVQFRKNFMAKSVAEIAWDGKNARKRSPSPNSGATRQSEMVACPYCHVSQPAGKSYCVGCGAALPTGKGAIENFLNKVQGIFDAGVSKKGE